MANKPSIFDRLRSMQTEGLPLHTLIVEACEVGNELIAALDALFNDYKELADSGDAGFWSLEDQDVGRRAIAALQRAYADNSNGNGSNGSNRSAA